MYRDKGGIQRQVAFKDIRGAQQFKEAVENVGPEIAEQILEANQHGSGDLTLAEWTTAYLDPESGLLGGVTDGTRANYRREAERSFLKHPIAHMPLSTIKRVNVNQWVTWQESQLSYKGKPLAPKTVKNYHGLLSAILGAAVVEELIPSNPAYRVKLTRGSKATMTFLTPQEYATLLFFIHPHYKPLVELLAWSGMRWGEATALKHGDIDFSTLPPMVHITRAWKRSETGGRVLGTTKTSKSERTIGMPIEVMEQCHNINDNADDFVFTGYKSPKPVSPSYFREKVWSKAVAKMRDKELCEKEGLLWVNKHPRIHDLRHSHASWMIANGIDLQTVKERLGHESITTTVDRYGHLMPDVAVASVNVMDKVRDTIEYQPIEQLREIVA